jgi:hypothetical protein
LFFGSSFSNAYNYKLYKDVIVKITHTLQESPLELEQNLCLERTPLPQEEEQSDQGLQDSQLPASTHTEKKGDIQGL